MLPLSAYRAHRTLHNIARITDIVSFVVKVTLSWRSVLQILGVSTAVAAILLLVLIVHHTNNGMRVLQSNIQSINISVPLLRQCSHRLHAETILLQEIWHPIDGHINIRNYNKTIVKLRNGREGGGVAIITV